MIIRIFDEEICVCGYAQVIFVCRFVFRSTDGSNSGGQSISRPFQDHGNIRHSKWTDTSLSFLEYHAMQLKNLGTLAASIQHSSRARRHGPLIFSQPATPIHAAYTFRPKIARIPEGGEKIRESPATPLRVVTTHEERKNCAKTFSSQPALPLVRIAAFFGFPRRAKAAHESGTTHRLAYL